MFNISTALRGIAYHRMALWLWVSIVLILAVAILAPQLLSVSLYKLSLITTAAWIGYWIDRRMFPYARPDAYLDTAWSLGAPLTAEVLPTSAEKLNAFSAAMQRRAIIVAAAMLAAALGA